MRIRAKQFAYSLVLGLVCSISIAQEPLLGNWNGNRDYLAEKGITFDLDLVNFYQGVTSGGVEQDFGFAGHGDYVANFQLGKLGFNEGLFLKVRAEHRFGESINGNTGSFIPAAILTDLPVADNEELHLTNFLFTQMLTERFAVFFGKLDTLDGDLNAFAHGRGKKQFSNLGFVSNPIALRTIPYSTLGGGFSILGGEGEPVFTYTLLNATDTTESAGFDELFEEGVAMAAELRVPVEFRGLPGHQLIAATWNSRDFATLGQDPRFVLPNVPINEVNGSWSTYYNFDQYLYVDPCNPQNGWGLFGRAGIADDSTNPISWFLSLGVGGNNPMRGREADTFGVGWFMAGSSDEIGVVLEALLGPVNDGHGVELFYNYQATSWLNITPDLQILVPSRDNVDTAVVAGVRAVMKL